MIEKLLSIRYIYLIAVFFTCLNSIVFLISGVIDSVHGYQALWQIISGVEKIQPELFFVEALDKFLVAFVFLIFSIGITKFFIFTETTDKNLPGWLNITSFKELKILLWETILVSLVVFTIATVVENRHHVTWEILFLPAVVLILSLSLYLMRSE